MRLGLTATGAFISPRAAAYGPQTQNMSRRRAVVMLLVVPVPTDSLWLLAYRIATIFCAVDLNVGSIHLQLTIVDHRSHLASSYTINANAASLHTETTDESTMNSSRLD